MALKVQMSQIAVLVNPLPSSSISFRSRSTKLPLGGLVKPLLKCRRQRAGVARASGTAKPESAGTGGSGLVDSNMMVEEPYSEHSHPVLANPRRERAYLFRRSFHKK